MSLAFCVAFAILGGAAFENTAGEDRYLLLIAPIAGIILFFGLFISTYCQQRQYLLVFDDAVKYKKGLFGKEKQLIITPTDYKIKLKKIMSELYR